MRTKWKVMGGSTLVGGALVALILGTSVPVSGDSKQPPDQPSAPAARKDMPEPHDPNTPYPLGPHAIEYEKLSAADKAAVDAVQEAVETGQPPESYEAWSAATATAGRQAAAEIAARGVGLVGVAEDGVVP